MLHAKGETDLLQDIASFLAVFEEYGFKIHAKKTSFFLKEVKFYGRMISKTGVRYDPRNLEALLNMNKPVAGGQLQQLMCAANWMRTAVPEFFKLTAPSHDLLEKIYKSAGSRKKRAVSKISLGERWETEHTKAFDHLKKQLASAVELSHPKEGYRLCLSTDASESHWSTILTQSPISERKLPLQEQSHSPMALLSGSFKGHSKNWSVPEKEGFVIVEAMDRFNYLVSGRTVFIYTDHANLLCIFDPYGSSPTIPRHTASKLTRWAIKLNTYRFEIEHVSGERNVWAELMPRWTVQPSATVRSQEKFASLLLAPINPSI